MNASELHRKLLYCGYNNVTDYLRNSPLNRTLYRDFLSLLPKHGIKVPVVKMFNEIYYQLVRIPIDIHPGEDIEKRYVDECAGWLGSPTASKLVFSLVSTLMYHGGGSGDGSLIRFLIGTEGTVFRGGTGSGDGSWTSQAAARPWSLVPEGSQESRADFPYGRRAKPSLIRFIGS